MNNKTIVISLGGSIVVSEKGVDIEFLKKFKKFIINKVKKGYKFIIIVGGGLIARKYISSANAITKVSSENNDWLGIMATRFNAQLLQTILSNYADPNIVVDPSVKKRSKYKIIIGAGYKPGWSTDYDAVLMAINYKVKTILNLSNINYVYDKDPKKYKDVKQIDNISWLEFKKIVGNKWSPGLNLPFDPIASKKAAQAKLEVVIMNGRDLSNINKYLNNKKFIGTIIK